MKIETPGRDHLVAFLLVDPDDPPGRAELRRHALAHLTPAMVPTRLTVLDRFPMTPSGKTDRSRLRELGRQDGSEPQQEAWQA